ncbi:unnamed protein product [Moneuplotes crassus]|uniref:Uncharacterized protein n=1 Tax=Euplotes crassus TaxID=5936 RepID=A0AAD1Y3G9_EUPCR|nr:unnamed protein product [Moneuplotes crassus]
MGCCVSNEENEPVGLATIQDLQLGSKKKDRQDYQFGGDRTEVGSKGGFGRDCGENDGGHHCTPVSGETHCGNVHSSGHGVSSHGGHCDVVSHGGGFGGGCRGGGCGGC